MEYVYVSESVFVTTAILDPELGAALLPVPVVTKPDGPVTAVVVEFPTRDITET